MLNRTFITGLAEKCPFYSIPLTDCGLASLRGDGGKDGIQKRLESCPTRKSTTSSATICSACAVGTVVI